ncbi:hypothetical protein IV38_GL002008 [Lactobacillus selangorensis]|uniref:Bacterial membrane protein YfhO n=1 Tax=Lactobacillus selangorensis TaxID=81857 RepID=A0A0R2FG16_9LACO|nr:YfhO family protein [Lactobacillus selangorensis]KRN27553.1 hypothetical protein IV38_GL002008 [Lactobacillus selangorensis]KRN30174.1 hypothetical protein IV40_GL002020 [Lactobacillus selangorensis]
MKQRMQHFLQSSLFYLCAFLLALLTLMAAFWALNLTPFGTRNLLISDMGTQYIPFFTEFRHQLITHQLSLYSFSLSLGDNVLPLVAYYLLSPFNLLLVCFKASAVPTAISWIILLKVGTASLTMALFLKLTYHQQHVSTLLFAAAYSLCGFVAMYFYDVMWLDGVILLPLVALGLQRLANGYHSELYVFSLWLTIVTNYYMGYMTCLFSVCYFIYLLELRKNQQHRHHFWDGEQRLLVQYGLDSLFAGVMTLFILVPALLGMLKTGKQHFNWHSFLPTPRFGTSVFSQFGIVGSDYTQHLQHNPSVYISIFIFVLLIGFFGSKQIAKGRKKVSIGLFLALAASLWIGTLNTIWHMFQLPNGFPYRNAYFFSFVCIFLAYEFWLTKPWQHEPEWLGRSSVIAAALIILGYVSEHIAYLAKARPYPVQDHYLLQTLVILTLEMLLLYMSTHLHQTHLLWAFLLGIVVVGELGANFYGSFKTAKTGDQQVYAHNYTLEMNYLKKTKPKGKAFYRVNNENSLINAAFQEPYNNYNDPLLFDLNGVNLYSSTLNEQTRSTLQKLGFYSKNARRISTVGTTYVTDSLFDIKYRLSMDLDHDSLHEHMASTLGIGYAVSPSIKQVVLQPDAALQNQQMMLNHMFGDQAEYFNPVQIESVRSYQLNQVYHYDIHARTTASGPLYVYFPQVDIEKSRFRVNGQLKKTRLRVVNQAVLSVGDYKQGQSFHFTFDTKQPQIQLSEKFQTLNLKLFRTNIEKLSHSQFQLQQNWHSQRLSGRITNTKNKVLFMSIPYDSGWRAFVDGQLVKPIRVVGGFLGVPLKPGEHQVAFYYRVPGLRPCSGISFGAFILYLAYAVILWRYDRHERSKRLR